MADLLNPMANILVVPHGRVPLPEQFVDFLFQREIPAILVMQKFVHEQESGQTGLGIRVAPGTC
jgi:hypothetical protein